MRPIQLTLEGFTSFRMCQTLDFSSLDLFAITGATGAGKSSLLDAMTFALYGKVARLGKDSGTSLVSQGAMALKVEFQFAVRQMLYRVTRSWQSGPKKAKTLFLLERFHEGKWVKCARTEKIEQILRMDFNAFIRVVLLPQGQFDEFLKRDPKKRRELLRQLAGLDIFERMRQEAFQRAKQYNTERQAIERLLKTIEVPTSKEVLEKQAQLVKLGQRLSGLDKQAILAQKQLDDEERLLALIKRLSELQGQFALLDDKREAIAQLDKQLRQAQQADRLAGEWAKVEEARRQDETALEAAPFAEENVEEALAVLQDKRATLMDYVGQQLKVADVRTQAVYDWVIAADLRLVETTPDEMRLAQLKQIAAPLIHWQEKTLFVLAAREKWQEASDLLEGILADHDAAVLAVDKALADLQAARAFNETLQQQNHAAALRALLHTGDNCLVCGGLYPEAHKLPSLPELAFMEIEPLQTSYREAEEALQIALTAKTKAETTLENLQDLPYQEADLADLHEQITEVLATDEWEAADLELEYEALQERADSFQEALQEKEQADNALEKAEMALRFAREAFEETREQYEDSAAEQERQQLQLQEAEMALDRETDGLSYEHLSETLEQYEEDLARRINQANRAYQIAHDDLIEAETANKQAMREVESALDEKEQREETWQSTLQALGLTEDNVLNYKALPEEQAAWESEMRDYQDAHIVLETEMKSLRGFCGDQTTDEAQIEQRREAKAIAVKALQAAYQQKMDLSSWLLLAKEKQAQAKNQKEETITLDEQAQIYHILAQKLQSDEFQSYLLEQFERELVARATVLLHDLTDARYALEIQEGDYWVTDHWNGSESRRVRTLSGGETFAASLAMALALSEKLAKGTELGSLFLDEGFGTLDMETLDSVTLMLESLRQQDRLIGIITHIPALAERLPAQVKVSKSPEGSRLVIER
ncbi:MAG: SMC family ATPase [Candidatus Parabeggiatoa sp. nov. 3]|nr:MAG: SMC family ATPase [Gammaproteobacteria bacterium]RKZ62190.1 MAG: SMC family ATPase [Gammaproteobacteria bacterium]RKZ85219.1 MAG: SMC family ATPase [Gammaproteobacteria bacterium]